MAFQLYTESARRVIFLGREEALRCGSSRIEVEHLLLGILHENDAITSRIAGPASTAQIRREIEAAISIGQPVTAPIEVPLSDGSKRLLNHAVEEAESLRQKQVSIGHFLLAILRAENSAAARILQLHGVTTLGLRENTLKDIRWADAPD